MTRPPSSDEPSREIFHHMQRARWRRRSGLYVMSDGFHTQAAYTSPLTASLNLGQPYIAEREAAKDLWRVDVPGGSAFVFSYSNADGTSSQYKILPVTASGYGAMRDGPLVDEFVAALDVAFNSVFMVASIGDGSTAGVFLWNGSTFAATPVDTVQPDGPSGFINWLKISPDSATVIFGMNGGVAAYPVSSAGFGTVYAGPPSPPPVQPIRGISWHPSGEAVAIAWDLGVADPAEMTAAVWAWSAGWGSRYADPADPASGTLFTGTATQPAFAPDGDTLFLPRVNPGDSANGQFRIYDFTLASGLTTRVAFSTSPIAGPISFNQNAYSGRLVALGTKNTDGLITYTFLSGTIGPGVGHLEYQDNFPEFPEPENAVPWEPQFLCFSRDGRLLLGSSGNAGVAPGIFRLFAVDDDGTLTQLGATFSDPFESGWYKIAWREG